MRHDLPTLSMALATLEAAIAEHALSRDWRGSVRREWLRALPSVATAAGLQRLMLEFDRNVQWADFEAADEAGEDDDEPQGRRREEGGNGPAAAGRSGARGAGRDSSPGCKRDASAGGSGGGKRARQDDRPEELEPVEVEVEVGRGAPAAGFGDDGGSRDAKDIARRRDKRRRDGGEDDESGVSARTRHTRMHDEMMQRALDSAGGAEGGDGEPAESTAETADAPEEYAAGTAEDAVSSGGDMSCVEHFFAHAARLKRAIYGPPTARNGGSSQQLLAGREATVRAERIEADFWRAVSGWAGGDRGDVGGGGEVDPTVTFSATPVSGTSDTSGFARPSEAHEDPYALSPWSPHNLPTLPSSLFSHLLRGGPAAPTTDAAGDGAQGDASATSAPPPAGLDGLIAPRMRLGMLWSVESPAGAPRWGVQPSLLYGASFLLAGAPKTWYAVPPADADAFEALLRRETGGTSAGSPPDASEGGSAAAELAGAPPVLMPPSLLATAQLQVCRVEQQPGELVLTAPRCYHFALSHGATVSESTVLATDDWLPYGWLAHCSAKQAADAPPPAGVCDPALPRGGAANGAAPPAFSLEELVLRAACAEPSVRASGLLLETLRPIAAAQAAALDALRSAGASVVESVPQPAPAVAKRARGSAVARTTPVSGDDADGPAVAAQEGALAVLLAAAEPWVAPGASGGQDGGNGKDVSAQPPRASCPACCICAQPCFLATVRCTACGDAPGAHNAAAASAGAQTDGKAGAPRVACAEHGLRLGCGCGFSRLAVTVTFPPSLLARFEALLCRRLAQRTRWLAAADGALAGRPSLEVAVALLAEAERMQLKEEPQVGALAARRGEGERWAARAVALLVGGRVHTLAALEAHVAKGEALPLELSQLAALRRASEQARAWEARAQAALAPAHGLGAGAARAGGEAAAADGTGWDPSRARSEPELRALLLEPGAGILKLPLVSELEDEIHRLGWVSAAAGMAATEPELEELKALLARGEELRVRHLPDAVDLARRCATASRWAHRANNALRRRSYLPALESLAAEGATLGVATEQLREVHQRIAAATSWGRRARAALRIPEPKSSEGEGEAASSATGEAGGADAGLPSVETIRALAVEAAALDVAVPEEAKVAEMVKDIDRWVTKASAMLVKRGSDATLLQLLQHEAAAPPLEAMNEAESGGADGGATLACAFCTGNDMAATSKFMIGCDVCDRWYHGPCVGVDKKAADAMTDYTCLFCARAAGGVYAYGPPFPVPKRTRRPRLRQVAALLDEAAKIEARMPEVEPLRALLLEAEAWQVEAVGLLEEAADNGGGDGGPPKLRYETLEAALAAGEACEVEPDALAALRKMGSQFLLWQARARAVLKGEHRLDEPLTPHEVAIELALVGEEQGDAAARGADGRGDASGDGGAADGTTTEDRPGSGGSGGWPSSSVAAAAATAVDRAALRGVSPNTLGGLHLLLLEADELRVTSNEVTQLQAMGDSARRWRQEARCALAPPQPDEAVISSLLSGLEALPLRLHERAELHLQLATQRWLLTRRPDLVVALASGRPAAGLLHGLCAEAAALGLSDLAEVTEAAARVQAASEWDSRADEALRTRGGITSLAALLGEADDLAAEPAREAELRRRVDNASSWAERAAAAVEGSTSEEGLAELLAQAEDTSVPPVDREPLLQKADLARWCRERLAAAFVKEGCRLSLAACLEGDGHYELTTEDGGWAAYLACSFCTGASPFETAQFMIGCDGCDRWYHGPCVGVSKAQGDALNEYTCPACAAEAGTEYKFGPPTPVPCKTRRPRRALVAALLAESNAAGVQTAEEASLRQLLQQAEEWDREAVAVLGGAVRAGEAGDGRRDGEGLDAKPGFAGGCTGGAHGEQGESVGNGVGLDTQWCADLERVRALVARAGRLEVTPDWLPQAKAARDRLENWHRNYEMLEQVYRALAAARPHWVVRAGCAGRRGRSGGEVALHIRPGMVPPPCASCVAGPPRPTLVLSPDPPARARLLPPSPCSPLCSQGTPKSAGRAGLTASSMAPSTTFNSHGFLSAGAFPGDALAIGASLSAEAAAIGLGHKELVLALDDCVAWRAAARQALRFGADAATLAALCNASHLLCSPEAELVRISLVRAQAMGQLLNPADAAATAGRAAAEGVAAPSGSIAAAVTSVPAAAAPRCSEAGGAAAAAPLPYTPTLAARPTAGPALQSTAPPPVLMGSGVLPSSYTQPAAVPAPAAPLAASAALLDGGVSLMAEEVL